RPVFQHDALQSLANKSKRVRVVSPVSSGCGAGAVTVASETCHSAMSIAPKPHESPHYGASRLFKRAIDGFVGTLKFVPGKGRQSEGVDQFGASVSSYLKQVHQLAIKVVVYLSETTLLPK